MDRIEEDLEALLEAGWCRSVLIARGFCQESSRVIEDVVARAMAQLRQSDAVAEMIARYDEKEACKKMSTTLKKNKLAIEVAEAYLVLDANATIAISEQRYPWVERVVRLLSLERKQAWRQAFQGWFKLAKLYPMHWYPLLHQVTCSYRLGEHASARLALERLHAQHSSCIEGVDLLAWLYLIDTALPHQECVCQLKRLQLVLQRTTSSQRWIVEGIAEAAAGNQSEALSMFARAKETDIRYCRSYLVEARLCFSWATEEADTSLPLLSRAFKAFAYVLKIDKCNTEALLGAVDVLLVLGRKKDALELINRTSKVLPPSDPHLRTAYGDYLSSAKSQPAHEKGLRSYKQALKYQRAAQGDCIRTVQGLVQLLVQDNLFADAIKVLLNQRKWALEYRTTIDAVREAAVYDYLLGDVYSMSNKAEEAVDVYYASYRLGETAALDRLDAYLSTQ